MLKFCIIWSIGTCTCTHVQGQIETHRNHLDAHGREPLGIRLFHIASDAADLEFLGEHWICEDILYN